MAEHVRGDLPGQLGAVGDPLDDLLGLTRPDESAVVQSEVGLQDGADVWGQRDDPLLAPRAVRGSLAGNAEGPLLPLDVVQGQGTEFRDAESGIQQGPDDQLLLGAVAGVGEPIGLVGPEGLADELVGHLLTRLTTRSVRSWSAIANWVRFLPSRVSGGAWRKQRVPSVFSADMAHEE